MERERKRKKGGRDRERGKMRKYKLLCLMKGKNFFRRPAKKKYGDNRIAVGK